MKYIFGNWKMYLTLEEAKALSEDLAKNEFTGDVKLAVFPSALAVGEVIKTFAGTDFAVGAQTVNWTPKGAYTGAVSAFLYKEAGCEYSLVGHSERRHVFGETDEEVRKKIEACLENNLIPVVCIGETKEEKDNNQRDYRLKTQMEFAFKDLNLNGGKVIVAYEPVWAIGTGDACNPADADDVQGWIKTELKKYFDKEIPVLYGGSVNEKNVSDYVRYDTIDGVLVGGASTKLDTFTALINNATK
jgi:triosephosphate isomerase